MNETAAIPTEPGTYGLQTGVLILGPQGEIRLANAAAQAILGQSTTPLAGTQFADLCCPTIREDGSAVAAAAHPVAVALATRQAVPPAILGINPPGQADPCWLLAEADVQLAPDGAVATVIYTFTDITAHRQVAAAAHHSEGRFAKTFHASPDFAAITRQSDQRIIDVNENWLRLFGYERAEVIGRTHQEIGLTYDYPAAAHLATLLRSQGSVRDLDMRVRTRADTALQCSISIVPIEIEGEAYILAMGRDISERKQAEEALRRSEERFAKIFRASPVGIAISRVSDGRILDVNDIWVQVFGYPREELVEQPAAAFDAWVQPEDRAEIFRRLRAQEPVHDFEVPLRGKSRESGIYSIAAEIIEIDHEPCVLWLIYDITERKQAEQQLRHQLDLTRAITHSLGEGVYTLDLEGRVMFMNPAAERLLGWKAGELLGEPIHDRIHAPRPDGTWMPREDCPLLVAIRTGQTIQILDDYFQRKDGSFMPVTYTASPIISDGQVIGEVAVFRDLTERKKIEDQARAAERLSALGRVAAGVAHEFNNVLAGIMGRLDLLAAQTTDPASAATLRLIERAADDGVEMVKRIQTFARLRNRDAFTIVSVSELVSDVIALTEPHWKAAHSGRPGISLRTQIEQGLLVRGNPTELREVLINLILNAVDALPQGGRILIGAELHDRNVELTVADTGIGVDPAMQERIFEPFFTTKVGGSGLGLALVKDLLQSHGGTITVHSTLGAGTQFKVTLPAAPDAPPAARPAAAPAAPTAAPHGARILAVDDDPGLGAMLRDILVLAGHEVVVATNGHEALAHVEQAPFDLVCTDLGMPGMNGWELGRQIRARVPGTPLVLITGWGSQIDPADLANAAFDFVLSKPYRAAQVYQIVAQALARARN